MIWLECEKELQNSVGPCLAQPLAHDMRMQTTLLVLTVISVVVLTTESTEQSDPPRSPNSEFQTPVGGHAKEPFDGKDTQWHTSRQFKENRGRQQKPSAELSGDARVQEQGEAAEIELSLSAIKYIYHPEVDVWLQPRK